MRPAPARHRSQDHAGVIAWPPLIFAAHALAGGAAQWIWPVTPFPAWPSRILGAILILASGLVATLAKRAMERAGTAIKPSQPTTAIVEDGPYRFTRNPMYLSLCALYLGMALLIDGLLPLLLVVPLAMTLHFGVIRREERYLAAKFGDPYLAYQRRVRRWI